MKRENLERVEESAAPTERTMTENELLKSFDAHIWADAFMEIVNKSPAPIIDKEFMVGWFANALMRGFDEHYRRTPECKRKIRRALFPWWSWRRYAKS